jgi:hypothetical protein
MKITILLLLFIQFALSSSDYELQLFEKVIPAIFKSNKIKIYVTADVKSILKKSSKFIIVDKCDNATVLLIGKKFTNLPIECQNKPLFATNYKYYKRTSQAFGAFYWRKGRPQLRFKTDTLKEFHLDLPQGLQKYADN